MISTLPDIRFGRPPELKLLNLEITHIVAALQSTS